MLAPGLAWSGVLVEQNASVLQALYGVGAMSGDIAWAAGVGGMVIRTVNGGVNWMPVHAPSSNIWALSAREPITQVIADGGG